MGLDYLPDEELMEDICENEKDSSHLIGQYRYFRV
jgi:hypothetical protein